MAAAKLERFVKLEKTRMSKVLNLDWHIRHLIIVYKASVFVQDSVFLTDVWEEKKLSYYEIIQFARICTFLRLHLNDIYIRWFENLQRPK